MMLPSIHRMNLRYCLLSLLACYGLAVCASASSVTLHYQKVHNFPVKYVAVRMSDPEVTVATALAPSFPHGLESWNGFLNRLQPDAAINGTYFCLRTSMPVGDVASEGSLYYRGVAGTALCITPENRIDMRPGPTAGTTDWTGYRTVLTAGPRLLTAGAITLDARTEGFRDPRVLGSAPRSAAAVRPDGTLLLLTIETNISLRNLAAVCLKLGATDAMCLDGGTSSGLYAEGRTVTRPGRGMSNMLVVYATRDNFTRHASALVPGNAPLLAALLPPSLQESIAYVTPPVVTPPPPVAPPQLLPVQVMRPDPAHPVRGTVSIVVDVDPQRPPRSVTLRINGTLRAMANVWPLVFHWDTTAEVDGLHTVEAIALDDARAIIARDTRAYQVDNGTPVAQR